MGASGAAHLARHKFQSGATKYLVFPILGLALGLAKRPCGVVLRLLGLALGLLETLVFSSIFFAVEQSGVQNSAFDIENSCFENEIPCFPDFGFGSGPREAALRRCFVVVWIGHGPVENLYLQIQTSSNSFFSRFWVWPWASRSGLAALLCGCWVWPWAC